MNGKIVKIREGWGGGDKEDGDSEEREVMRKGELKGGSNEMRGGI